MEYSQEVQALEEQIQQAAMQIWSNEARKTCFDKCFTKVRISNANQNIPINIRASTEEHTNTYTNQNILVNIRAAAYEHTHEYTNQKTAINRRASTYQHTYQNTNKRLKNLPRLS